jgi:hypothetical protein
MKALYVCVCSTQIAGGEKNSTIKKDKKNVINLQNRKRVLLMPLALVFEP